MDAAVRVGWWCITPKCWRARRGVGLANVPNPIMGRSECGLARVNLSSEIDCCTNLPQRGYRDLNSRRSGGHDPCRSFQTSCVFFRVSSQTVSYFGSKPLFPLSDSSQKDKLISNTIISFVCLVQIGTRVALRDPRATPL